MRRREFVKQFGTYPLALRSLAAQTKITEPVLRAEGNRRILDLSGTWLLRIDTEDRGKHDKWFETEPSDSIAPAHEIEAPSIWQQYFDIDGGIAWYFKTFSLRQDQLDGALQLRFGSADYRTEVWLNGTSLGVHEGAFTPFEFDIRSAARQGTNRLTARVSDVGRDYRPEYCGLPGWEKPTWKPVDGIYFDQIPAGWQDWREGFNHCGIWLPVDILAADSIYVSDAFILPNVNRGAIECRVAVRNQSGKPVDARIEIEVQPWKQTTIVGGANRAVRLHPAENEIVIPVDIQGPRLWSPDDPYLYAARVRVHEGSVQRDELRARFGLREFTVGPDGYFHLNGKRIFLKGAHYQSTEPLTLIVPHNLEMARKIITTAKEGGFNFMRFQGRPATPSILDAAEELGIMLQSEPAVSRLRDSSALEELAVRETQGLVKRDRNRACVVIWNMINEQAPGLRVVQKMVEMTRQLDPTRLITESAGGPSHFYRPNTLEGVSYLTEHGYQNAPLSEGVLKYWRSRGLAGQLYFVTEFGFGGLEDIDAVLEQYGPEPKNWMEDYHGFVQQKTEIDNAFVRTSVRDIFPDVAALREAAQTLQANAHKFAVESLRSNPRVGGFNVVQLFDSNSNEVDGLVDFWRNKRKKSFAQFQELNRPLQLIVQFSPLNGKTNQEIEVNVALVNEEQISGAKTLTFRAVGPSDTELFSQTQSVAVPAWCGPLLSIKIPAGKEPGRVTLNAELREGSQLLVAKREEVAIYDSEAFWPRESFSLFDPEQRWPNIQRPVELKVRPYEPRAEISELVIITEFSSLWRNREKFTQFRELMDQVRRGSTALFMGIPSDGSPPFDQRNFGIIFNFSALTLGAAIGFALFGEGQSDAWGKHSGPYAWATGNTRTGCPVSRHPVFEGLPGPGLMDWQYGNVVAGEAAVPHWLPIENTGPDLPIIPLGSGRVVLCTYKLLDQMERDGLAAKLFSNIVTYLQKQLPSTLRARSPREEERMRYFDEQCADCWDKFLSKPNMT